MRKAVISIPHKKDEDFFQKLFEKMGIRYRFLSDEEMEDIILGKMMDEGRTGKTVSQDRVIKELKRNGR